MTLPLYPFPNGISIPETSAEGNRGLYSDKFCDGWSVTANNQWDLTGEAKQAWIAKVAKKPAGNPDDIRLTQERYAKLVKEQGGIIIRFSTDSRLVPGLGYPNPTENGMAWHYILGVPYLPGSSIKGLVREWAEQWSLTAKDEVIRVFGAVENEKSGQMGSVIFYDALPEAPEKLECDVMTPHYASTGIPGDWQNPNPIPFLAVAKEQVFRFALAPCNIDEKEDMHTVAGWLTEALENLGVGAKTGVGYGYFKKEKGGMLP